MEHPGRAVAGPLSGKQLDRVISIESFWFDWGGVPSAHPHLRPIGAGRRLNGATFT
jgi:hypothetical protein